MRTINVAFIVASLLMVVTMISPTFAVNGPIIQNLKYKFYSTSAALFTALTSGMIDLMGWPLNSTQYAIASATPTIQLAPYYGLDDYEIAFNNNATDPAHMTDRKAMNYTEFRQAMACLIDKDGLIASASVGGFATRIDTQIARPMLNAWVNLNVSKYDSNGNMLNNYPWDYNTTKALEILWTNNWYSHETYPTLASLLIAYYNFGPLPLGSVVYPPDHPRAGIPIDSIVAYIRSDLPNSAAGTSLVTEMTKLGIATSTTTGGSGICYAPVFVSRQYDFYTAAWSFATHPVHFYSMNTPVGIHAGGLNIYMIDDAEMTFHANLEYPDATTLPQAVKDAKDCQYIQVMEAMLVPLYTTTGYIAYWSGAVGVIDFRGYGLTRQLDYTWMNMKISPYTGSMTVQYGTLNPPTYVNPIFSYDLWDYEILDSIFTGPMAINPFNPIYLGKSPSGADQPWMAYDWNWQLSDFNGGGGWGNPLDSYTQMANVTYWFRHDITWQDGVPWTVQDMNYTMHLHAAYGDSWGYSDAVHIVNFVKIDNWTCSFYYDMPTFWSMYTANYDEVPMHIYQYIDIPAGAGEGGSVTGHHGYWPGADATPGEILPGAPFTYSQLTSAGGEKYTWIGTGMWKYVPGTLSKGTGGSLTLVPYSGFWMNITQGDIDFRYTWNVGPAPQGGSYAISLSDLVMLANAYGTTGTGAVPLTLGGLHVWEPGCDIAPPACRVGLTDLVTLAMNYGKHWGVNP